MHFFIFFLSHGYKSKIFTPILNILPSKLSSWYIIYQNVSDDFSPSGINHATLRRVQCTRHLALIRRLTFGSSNPKDLGSCRAHVATLARIPHIISVGRVREQKSVYRKNDGCTPVSRICKIWSRRKRFYSYTLYVPEIAKILTFLFATSLSSNECRDL